MNIKIIAEASSRIDRHFGKWGLSILINDEILFDTFSTPQILENNFKRMQVDVAKIKKVIISHEHWDHTGGLSWVLQQNKYADLIVGAHFSNTLKDNARSLGHKVIELEDDFYDVYENIYSTGEIKGFYNNKTIHESSLVLLNKERDDIVIITGCAHPGVINIINRVKTKFSSKIKLLMGGFHLNNKTSEEIDDIVEELKSCNIEFIAPCHCTGKKSVDAIKKAFDAQFLKVKSRLILDI